MSGSLPYNGDLQLAIKNQDRNAIKILMAQRKSTPPPIEKPLEKPKSLSVSSKCQNETDFITGEEWSSETPPIIIHFKNVHDVNKENVLCFDRESFITWIKNKRNTFARWIPNEKNSVLEEINEDGHGGRPSYFEKFIKLPIGGYIIPEEEFISNEYIAIPWYDHVRIGNVYGIFAIGSAHGQLPGESVYYLIPSDKNIRKEILKLFLKNTNNNVLEQVLPDDFATFLQTWDADKIIEEFGGYKRFSQFMTKLSKSLKTLQSNLESAIENDNEPGKILFKIYKTVNILSWIKEYLSEYLTNLNLQDLINIIIKYNAEYLNPDDYKDPFVPPFEGYDEYIRDLEIPEPEEDEEGEEISENEDLDIYIELLRDIQTDNYDEFIKTLSNFPDINLDIPFEYLTEPLGPGAGEPKILLMEAMIPHGERYAQKLLELGARVNVTNNFYQTPLILAVAIGEIELVKLLLLNEADPNIQDDMGATALFFATSLDIVKLLIDNGADVNIQNYVGHTILMYYIETPNSMEKIIKYVIETGQVRLEIRDQGGATLLMWAAARNFNIFSLLLKMGADPNVQDHKGYSILMDLFVAAPDSEKQSQQDFRFRIFNRFTKNPDKILFNLQNDYGETALMIAVKELSPDIENKPYKNREYEMIQKLIINTDIYLKDEEGKTVLHFVNNVKITKMLLIEDKRHYYNFFDNSDAGNETLQEINKEWLTTNNKKYKEIYDLLMDAKKEAIKNMR